MTNKAQRAAPLGVHLSIAGGLHTSIDRAAALGCGAFQIFGHNPRSWAYAPPDESLFSLFREKRAREAIGCVAVHTSYLINLSSPDGHNFKRSAALFRDELKIAESIGADYLVTHLGSPIDRDGAFARARVLEALKEVFEDGGGLNGTLILLENTSGAGTGFGQSLTDIGELIDGAAGLKGRLGLCFDTCHAFASGYPMSDEEDIERLMRTIQTDAGANSLKLIHLNDSKGKAASKLDRHEHIGKGMIGAAPLRAFLNHPFISGVPLILETPKKTDGDDIMNMRAVRELLTAQGASGGAKKRP